MCTPEKQNHALTGNISISSDSISVTFYPICLTDILDNCAKFQKRNQLSNKRVLPISIEYVKNLISEKSFSLGCFKTSFRPSTVQCLRMR